MAATHVGDDCAIRQLLRHAFERGQPACEKVVLVIDTKESFRAEIQTGEELEAVGVSEPGWGLQRTRQVGLPGRVRGAG